MTRGLPLFKPGCGKGYPKKRNKLGNMRFSRRIETQCTALLHDDFMWPDLAQYPQYESTKGIAAYRDATSGRLLSVLNANYILGDGGADQSPEAWEQRKRLFAQHFAGFVDHGRYHNHLVHGRAQELSGGCKVVLVTGIKGYIADMLHVDPQLRTHDCMCPSLDPETGGLHPFAVERTDDPSLAPYVVTSPPEGRQCGVEVGIKSCCQVPLGPPAELPPEPEEAACPEG